MNQTIYSDDSGNWQIIKNPDSLIRFGQKSRAVVMESGDLYVENHCSGTIHNDILRILYDKRILSGTFRKNWTQKKPAESGFLTLQRYKETHILAIGESNRHLYRKESYPANIEYYKIFLQKAIERHPSIHFALKLIGIKDPSIERSDVVVINEEYHSTVKN